MLLCYSEFCLQFLSWHVFLSCEYQRILVWSPGNWIILKPNVGVILYIVPWFNYFWISSSCKTQMLRCISLSLYACLWIFHLYIKKDFSLQFTVMNYVLQTMNLRNVSSAWCNHFVKILWIPHRIGFSSNIGRPVVTNFTTTNRWKWSIQYIYCGN